MRSLFFALIASVALIQAVPAQTTDSAGIEATIQSQLDAFLADDVTTAFGFAAPGIQGMFGTPENFGMMVQRGYPMVWRPADVQYGDLREEGSEMAQRVIITDNEGRVHVLEYRLVDQGGQWRISGVQIIDAPGVAA